MKRPTGIIIVIVMDIIRIVLGLFPFLVSAITGLLPKENEFRLGFESAIGTTINPQVLGLLFGQALPTEIVLIALLVVICKRKPKAITVLLVIQLLVSLGSWIAFIWAGIMLLIVLLNKKCKLYLSTPQI